MPFTGSVDITDILANLGDPNHGLKALDGPARNPEQQEDDLIYRATMGEVDISTQTAMEPRWDLIWDVNGYYRELGIPWPFKALKKDLRVAYQERQGMDDERLTYIFKQLLQPKVRADYDKSPLGSRFRDRYLEEEERRLLSVTARELSEEEGRIVTVDELVKDINEERALRSEDTTPTWQWSYYLLRTRKNEYENLISWLGYLTHAFASRGLVKKISIGYIGDSPAPFVVKTWKGKTIYFLNEEVSPSLELAETAVSNTTLL